MALKTSSLSLLVRYENLVSTSAFICYALWASGPQLGGAPTKWMLLTVIFVIVGIFRYQYLTDNELRVLKNDHLSGQTPEIIFLEDKSFNLFSFKYGFKTPTKTWSLLSFFKYLSSGIFI